MALVRCLHKIIVESVWASVKRGGLRLTAQIFMGLDYQLRDNWNIGISSRFMVKQISVGIHSSLQF